MFGIQTVVCTRLDYVRVIVLQVIDTDRFEVVVVSPINHFVFTPMRKSPFSEYLPAALSRVKIRWTYSLLDLTAFTLKHRKTDSLRVFS